ncbi:hypothetical protein [Halopelagius fulvigenes]|uniref:Transposase n=1 Tax=Halopelagius fulvigenes TaxID=1198324 RepID=A0ABD5U2K4_9EURY
MNSLPTARFADSTLRHMADSSPIAEAPDSQNRTYLDFDPDDAYELVTDLAATQLCPWCFHELRREFPDGYADAPGAARDYAPETTVDGRRKPGGEQLHCPECGILPSDGVPAGESRTKKQLHECFDALAAVLTKRHDADLATDVGY